MKRRFDQMAFVFDTPLYETIDCPDEDAWLIEALFENKKCMIDGFCKGCGRESVFHSASGSNSVEILTLAEADFHGRSKTRVARLICQRDLRHEIELHLRIATYKIEDKDSGIIVGKIGQVPSHADIANGSLSKFNAVLQADDRSEFIRANGLAAHGVNIGAFVYLRRVFERLLQRARLRAGSSIAEDDFRKFRVREKIVALKDFLPPFMVENEKVYGVLSSGIHELTEQECASYYELLKQSCLLMLEQEKDQKEKAALEDSLRKSIGQINLKGS